MTSIDRAATESSLIALKERKRLLDDVWLFTLFAMFLAIGVPWFFRILEINLTPVAWSLFAYGIAYLLLARFADRLHNRRLLILAMGMVQASGVVFAGFLWHLTGSIQNPMFLLVFVIPVVASSLMMMNWQSYGTVLLSITTVVTVALVDTPELRWYLLQTGVPAHRLMNILPQASVSAPQPFPDLNPSPSYLFLLLALFAALLFAAALAADSLATLLVRLYDCVSSSTLASQQAESLLDDVLRKSCSPAVLVFADTFTVVRASDSFFEHFRLEPGDLSCRNLFELVDFSFPDIIQDLIAGNGGKVEFAVHRVEGKLRVVRVQANPVCFRGARCVYVNLEDVSDLLFLRAAFAVSDEPHIVIGPRREIVFFNPAAAAVTGDLQVGTDAAIPLNRTDLPEGWWELGTRQRQERQVKFKGNLYKVCCVAAPIQGERDALTVLKWQVVGATAAAGKG